jgi:hypothetical protein
MFCHANAFILSELMMNVFMLSIIMLSVFMQSVIMARVMASLQLTASPKFHNSEKTKEKLNKVNKQSDQTFVANTLWFLIS